MKTKNKLLIIVSLTLLSTILRLPSIGVPLDIDEGIDFHEHAFVSWKTLFFDYWDIKHTLFNALSRLSMKLFGVNEVTSRLPALLSGILAIPLLYWVCLLLLNSESTATLSSYLLAFSIPHLGYSHDGRGYTLSVLLALSLVLVILKLTERKNIFWWGFLLPVLGFCMVLNLVSDVFFIAAVSVFFLFAYIARHKREREGSSYIKVIIDFTPFVIMFGLIVVYYFILHSDLEQKVVYYGQLRHLSKFLAIFKFLVSPWGAWLYLIAGYGFLSLIWKNKHLLFICIFFIPILLISITGIMGPPRVYIYLMPFVFILVAQGIVEFSSQVKKISNKKIEYFLMAVVCFSITVISALSLMKHYPKRYERKLSTIDNAIQVSSYVAKKLPPKTLIIIPYRDKTLLHYLDDRIIDNMNDIFSEGQLNKVIFIGHRDIKPRDFPLREYYPGHSFHLNEQFFELIIEIEKIRIYNFATKISHFIPSVFNPNHESELHLERKQGITIDYNEVPTMVGKNSLIINNETGKEDIITSQSIKLVNIKTNEAYLLFIFARGFLQGSKAMLLSSANTSMPPAIAYLNEHQKGFNLGSSNFFWEMVFLLSPLNKGHQQFKELFHLAEGISNFDGFQSFILSK